MRKILITLTLLMPFAASVSAALTTTFEDIGNTSKTVDTVTTNLTVAVGDVIIMVAATNKKPSVATVAFTSTAGTFTELNVGTLSGNNSNPNTYLGYMAITTAGSYDFTGKTSVLSVTGNFGIYKLTADSGQLVYLDEAFDEWNLPLAGDSTTGTDALSWAGNTSYAEIGIVGVASTLRGLMTNTAITINDDNGPGKRLTGDKILTAGTTSFNNSWNITAAQDKETGGSLSIAFAEIKAAAPTYSIGGDISGLVGSITLQNNGANNLVKTTDGSFTFATELDSGATYLVTVSSQPTGQTCTVTNGSGTATTDVTNVAVTCADIPTYSIGGNVSGLSGSVTLQNNSGDNLTLSAEGNFAFATKLLEGVAYAVTISSQPATQTCAVTAGGNGTVATADVTNVVVECVTVTKFTVGGTVSGLSGSVTLQNNDGDDLTLSADGSFTFATAVTTGDAYVVTVSAQPATQTCTVTAGSGTVAAADITDVVVTCADTTTYSIGGTVAGLSGSVTLQNNGADDLVVNADGGFTFGTPIKQGDTYTIAVFTQPAGQTCTLSNGSGTVTAAVIDIAVACENTTTPPPVTGPATPIPTLSQWALILLATLFGLAVFSQRRRLFVKTSGNRYAQGRNS